MNAVDAGVVVVVVVVGGGGGGGVDVDAVAVGGGAVDGAAADDVGGVAAYNAVVGAGAATTAKVFQAFLEGRRSWQLVAMWSKDH